MGGGQLSSGLNTLHHHQKHHPKLLVINTSVDCSSFGTSYCSPTEAKNSQDSFNIKSSCGSSCCCEDFITVACDKANTTNNTYQQQQELLFCINNYCLDTINTDIEDDTLMEVPSGSASVFVNSVPFSSNLTTIGKKKSQFIISKYFLSNTNFAVSPFLREELVS